MIPRPWPPAAAARGFALVEKMLQVVFAKGKNRE